MSRHIVLGTAGHIDHGKTTLVRALTGIDPTRFQEERDRGMTIDIGFAYLDLPDGDRMGIVDVPGHERFVRNMLAGAAGIDLVLLVIDVNEGVMPQTREHLDIIRLLGVETGCVALTKIDTADEEFIELVREEVGELLSDTAFADAPMIPVSGTTGEGIEALKDTLSELAATVSEKSDIGFARLPVDRVFTMKGHGTVVTGTLAAGTLSLNDELEALPSGLKTRVRGMQSHGSAVEVIHAGTRTALNCANVSTEDLGRGDVLVERGAAKATGFFNGRVDMLPSAAHALKHRTKVKCYVGTASAVATPILIEGDEYPPGGGGFVQMRLDRPIFGVRGDRFILRSGSPEITIGGGELLDSQPLKVRKRSQVDMRNLADIAQGSAALAARCFLAEAPQGISQHELAQRLGIRSVELEAAIAEAINDGVVKLAGAQGDVHWAHDDVLALAATRMQEAVVAFFENNPTRQNMPREEARNSVMLRHGSPVADAALAKLGVEKVIEEDGSTVRLAGRSVELPEHLAKLRDRILEVFTKAGATPPLLQHLPEELSAKQSDVEAVVGALMESGALLRAGGGLAYKREEWQRIAEAIRGHFAQTETLRVSDLKDLLGVTRKHAMPILEYADATGLTLRRGDVRVLKK